MSGEGSQKGKAPMGSRVRYWFDNFMARGGFAVFLAVLTMFALGFIAMGILRGIGGLVWPDASAPALTDGLWRTFIEIADAGNIGDDSDAPILSKGIGILTIFVGMVLFSSMVAFITAQFEAKLEDLRKGKSEVIESGHTLILGFGDRVVEIVRELITANESEKDAAVAILADRDKEEMDDYFNERIPERKTTRIITRRGSPANVASLKKMGVDRARSITILSDARAGEADDVKAQADARVLKAVMAVVATVGEDKLPPVVVELHLDRNRSLAESIAPGKVTTLAEDSLLAKMLVQTSRVSGLALVYSDLVGFEGNEVYFHKPPQGWPPISFGQLQFHFMASVPLGVRQSNGALMLNPPASYVMRPDDDAIILAEDDSTIKFHPQPVYTPRQLPLSQRRFEPRPEKQLIVGWGNKSPIILDEYAQYLKPGSAIHIAVDWTSAEMQGEIESLQKRFPNIEIRLAELDVSSPEVLTQISPHLYDNVIILTREGISPEEADAATIALLLRFRQYFRTYRETTGQQAQTQIITEVMDSENTELVLKAGVKDYLISNQFVSKIFAQVGQEPDVMRVYDDLFKEEGSEIYLKPVELFFEPVPITLFFGDCMTAAQLRSEVCFGYRLAAEEGDPDKAHGIHIIPRKNEQLTLGPGDCLITLAENEE